MNRRHPNRHSNRHPNRHPNPGPRSLLVIVLLGIVAVAGAGPHLATLDAGFTWAPSTGPCIGSGPLADVAANAAVDSAPCASLASARDTGGDATAGFALPARLTPRLAR